MVALDLVTSRRLLSAASVGRLATVTKDGKPHVVPCCFAFADDRLYWAVDGKPKSTSSLRRLDNIRANSAVSFVVDHYADNWAKLWWVRVDGAAVIVDEAEALPSERAKERETAIEMLAGKYQQYREQEPQGAVIRIEIIGITGWAYDGSALRSAEG